MKVLDMHCDTVEKLWQRERDGEEASLVENGLHIDAKRMKGSGYLLQNFAIFVDLGRHDSPYEAYTSMRNCYQRQLAEASEYLKPVRSYTELHRVELAGKMGAMLTVEEGGVLEGNPDRLQELYRDGVRMMTLTWNYNNDLGTAAMPIPLPRREGQSTPTEPVGNDMGLTLLGKECVRRMEEMHMLLDVSHLSDRGIADALAITRQPIVASHSNARSVCNIGRNLPDDLIRRIAERGGVMGLNFYLPFLLPKAPWQRQRQTDIAAVYTREQIVDAVVKHAKHFHRIGGEECVALGSDFDGITTNKALPDCSAMSVLYDALRRAGFPCSVIDGIFYKNALRVYREVLG